MTGCLQPAALLLSALVLAGDAMPVPASLTAQTPSQDAAPLAQGQPAQGQPAEITPAAAPPRQTAYPGSSTTAFGARIASLLNDPRVAGAHWGIAVTTMDGTPLFGLDEAKLFRPASTAKLFTTAAAMSILGPEATTQTVVFFPTPDATGTVAGDISLVGGDDANFGADDVPWSRSGSHSPGTSPLADLQTFAAEAAAKGVHHITGKVIGSGGPWDPYPQGWEIEDQLQGYGAPVDSLSLADNTLRLTVKAGAAESDPALVTLLPDVSVYRVVSTIRTTDDSSQPPSISVHPVPGNGTLRLTGLIPFGKTYTAEIAVEDPRLFAAAAFRQALTAQGIVVDGGIEATRKELEESNFLHEARLPLAKGVPSSVPSSEASSVPSSVPSSEAQSSYTGQPPLFLRHNSPSLQQDITATLKESLNLHAELMLRRLGRAPGQPTGIDKGAAMEGARVVHQWLVDRAVPDSDFVFYDGSGLSVKDLVTPRAEAQLLAYAARQPWFPQWKAALPVGGFDGTLAARFTQPPLKGQIFAKTGTLGESRALAGYVRCASGRDMIFAILDDNHPPGSTADRAVMDRIVAAIAELE